MLKESLKLGVLFFLIISMGCAKRGTITGGKKDTIAPVLKMSFPKNGATRFTGKEIKLVFDEYVKLKDINKQLIISPPMKKTPEILPTTASKIITIKLKDSLQPNTTYSFNFGQSIQDNNENNPYKQFKYIFSTGNYIDSLKLGGNIKDAYNKDVDHFVSVMLYEVTDQFNDSVVYKENPRYITNTLDSLKTFRLENLKAGKYLLVALKDYNNNFRFDSKKDKIGFQKEYITLPNDTVFQLELFQEKIPFKTFKPKQASGNRILLPYEGNPKKAKIVLKNGQNIVPSIVTQFPKKDSLQVWFKPIKTDSLELFVNKNVNKDHFKFKLKESKKDTLSLNAIQNGNIDFRDVFTVHASVPLVKFDPTKMHLINKDSLNVPFTTEYDTLNQDLKFLFKKEPLEKYHFKILPGALTDLLEKTNDTLVYRLTTKNTTDYGNLRINLQNVRKFPVIVELTDSKGKVIASEYSNQNTTIQFDLLEPNKYTLRVIYDENKNNEWDAGNYLEKRQSEEVIYFPKPLDVRANWDVEQAFDLNKK